MSLCVSYRLHVEDGGLGDDHGPVAGVALQLGLGPVGGEPPPEVGGRLCDRSEPVLPHELPKVLMKDPFTINQRLVTANTDTWWYDMSSLTCFPYTSEIARLRLPGLFDSLVGESKGLTVMQGCVR